MESRSSSWDPFELRRRIGYVMQEVGCFRSGHCGTSPWFRGSSFKDDDIAARVDTLLSGGAAAVRVRGAPADELSGGQRRW